MPIEHINKTDTLNEGREKLNAAIDGANAADVTSKEADTKATQALANSESTQTQLDTIVIDGDSSVEAAQARVDEKGVPHPTLKARIDDGMNSVNQQLAQTVTIDKLNNRGVDIEDFSSFVVDDDWSPAFEEALSISHKIFIGDVELGISRPITTDGRIELVGSGKSEIKALNKMTYMLDITNTDYVDVSGIFFNGEDTTSRGVRVANSKKSNFINCRFENFHSDMNDSVRVFLIDRYNVDNLSITKCIFKNLYAEPNNIVGDDPGVCRAIDISSGSGSIAQLSKNIIIDACSFEEIHTVEDADAIGIIFASDMLPIDVTISNCRFHNVAKRAVKAQASNIKMTNNVVTMDYDEEQLSYVDHSVSPATITVLGNKSHYGSGVYRKHSVYLGDIDATRGYIGEAVYNESEGTTRFNVYRDYVGNDNRWIGSDFSSLSNVEVRTLPMNSAFSVRGRDCIVSGNEVHLYAGSFFDITGAYGGSAIVTDNWFISITPNIKYATEGAAIRGCRISESVLVILRSNVIRGQRRGIELIDSDNTTISENTIEMCEHGVLTNSNSTNALINANTFNNVDKGIVLAGMFNRGTVQSNRINLAKEEPIHLTNASRTIVINNVADLDVSSAEEVVTVSQAGVHNVVRDNEVIN